MSYAQNSAFGDKRRFAADDSFVLVTRTMTYPYLITAIGTPLDADERLHEEGLEQHLADQAQAKMDGILVAGSMGLMQMLRGETYQCLIERSSSIWRGKGELLVGVGDTSWTRTLERIQLACRYPIDGVVVVTPYFFRFSPRELILYFQSLADASPVPLYLYDLPARTGVDIDFSIYETLVKHPNVKGAKISGRLECARQLISSFNNHFRVIVAEPEKINVLLREGIGAHLDGIFAVSPKWVKNLAEAAVQQDWDNAALVQRKMTDLRNLLLGASSPFGAFTAMMNARGIVGRFHAAPYCDLDESEVRTLVDSPVMKDLLAVRN